MAGRKKKIEDKPPSPPCSFPGCVEPGDYKAPLSPTQLRSYRFLCLSHVREFNANWDYFSGMDGNEIESFMKDAMLGHRPTWKINSHIKDPQAQLEEALYDMLHGDRGAWKEKKRKQQTRTSTPQKERRALAQLNLEGEVSLQEIKKQYKLLVKKFHPDVNPGDAQAADRFKHVTEAYQELIKIRSSNG